MHKISKIHNRIMQYINKTSRETGIPKWWLYVDCIWNCITRKKTIRDYFVFKFYYLNHFGKHEYLSGLEQNRWQTKHNDREMESILMNKEKSLKHFDSIIKRDWCGLTENSSREHYQEFAYKHEYAIFKPLDQGGERHKNTKTS